MKVWGNNDAATAEEVLRNRGDRWTHPEEVAKALYDGRRIWRDASEADKEDLRNRARAAIQSLSNLERKGRDQYRLGRDR